MSVMVRKQIYIEPHQQALLKRLAETLGVSEAELIRRAIDEHLAGRQSVFPPPDTAAWEKAHRFMRALHDRGPIEGKSRDWDREDLYEERLSRYEHHSD